MNKTSEAFLKKLLEAPSPSGFEQPAAAVFIDRVKGAVDELITDVHGNVIAVLNPKAKFKFMISGHIDEIGLMITHIDDKGYIYTAQIGGMDPALLIGQRVKIMGKKGDVFGVIGRKAIHQMKPEERKKNVEMDNIWVDIGADSCKDAEKRVSVGDAIVIDVAYRRLNSDKIVSRAMDDKAGAFVVAEVMRALSKRKLNISVIGVATVQTDVVVYELDVSNLEIHRKKDAFAFCHLIHVVEGFYLLFCESRDLIEALAREDPVGVDAPGRKLEIVISNRVVLRRAADLDDLQAGCAS